MEGKLKQALAVLLACSITVCSFASRPVKTQAVVVETITIVELIEMLILSFGASYLTTEGLVKAKDAYSIYVDGTGALKLEEVVEEQEELAQEPSPSQDPKKSSSPGGGGVPEPVQFGVIKMTAGVLKYAWEFYADFFQKYFYEDNPSPAGKSYSYELTDDPSGFFSRTKFGSHPVYPQLENLFTDNGTAYKAGSILQVRRDNGIYVRQGRFMERGNPRLVPLVFFDQWTSSSGSFLYSIDIDQADMNFFYKGNRNTNAGIIMDSFRSGTYWFGGDFLGTASLNNGAVVGGGCSNSSFDKLYADPGGDLYIDTPCLIGDGFSGKYYYWDGEKLVHRQFGSNGYDYTDTGVGRPYVYTSNGAYESLGDIYDAADMLQMIGGQIDRIQDYIETNFPDEVPEISYEDLEALQPQIKEAMQDVLQEYPMQQPDTGEVPSTYPQEVGKLFEDAIKAPQPDPDPDPGTKPDPNPDPDPKPDPDPGTDPDGGGSGKIEEYSLNLIDYFPFCIPRDVYLLIDGLVAEPRAPSFRWNVPSLDTSSEPQENIVTIDLAAFDSVAVIMRFMEKLLFLFCLILVSRRIVKGG